MAEKIRIGIHQPNFIPWLPYFHKMSKCDIFVLLTHVQFEKNGFQNRYSLSSGEWVTMPVHSGLEEISGKNYIGLEPKADSGHGSLVELNTRWIKVIADTLRIKTQIVNDDLGLETRSEGKTERLVDIIKSHTAGRDVIPVYMTNPDAKDKYLDEDFIKSNGIDIEYCKCPKDMKIHVFEAFHKWGIEGTIKQLKR